MKRKRLIGVLAFVLTVGTAQADNGIGGVDSFYQYNGYITLTGWACTLSDFSPVDPNKRIQVVQDATGYVYFVDTMPGIYYPSTLPQCIRYPNFLNNAWGWMLPGHWEPGTYSFFYEETLDRTWVPIGTVRLLQDPCSPICP